MRFRGGVVRRCHDHGMDGSSFFKAPASEDAFNRMARPSCSECDSPDITWMSTDELLRRVPEDEKVRVREGIAFLGAGGRAWLCDACGGFGIMGDAEWSGDGF